MPGAGREVDAGLLADRADVDACLARADLFDEGELIRLQLIAVRLRRGIALTAIQRGRLRDAIRWVGGKKCGVKMPPEPDFEALRAERNRRVTEMLQKLADEEGVPSAEIHSNFDPDKCYCACASHGPCEHRWDGAGVDLDGGRAWSATCSRCGSTAIGHAIRVLP